DIDQILKNADLAMYAAKAAGRRTYRFFETDMEAEVRARRSLEMDLRRALVDGGFEVYYQPCVDLQTNAITGCEALVRWRHPQRGMISPAEFIPRASRAGGALAPRAARFFSARRVHPAGRGHRPDQPARRVGAEHGLQGSR